MKQKLLTSLTLMLTALCLAHAASATDLVVNAGGAGGTFASLNAAIAAASSNDRIIVYPQPNGASYSEGTISITKSLQILSANEGAFYTIDGNINITPSTAGISLTIIGMRLLTGGIQSTISAPTGARSIINILNDSVVNGSVVFNHNNYNVTAASSYLGTALTFPFGKALGNVVNGPISCGTDASVNNPTDTVLIIGNKCGYYAGGNNGGINWASTSQFFSIQNNFIQVAGGAATGYGIYVSNSKSSLTGTNTIYNNTVSKSNGAQIGYAYTIATNANSNTDVQNNLYVGTIWYGAYAFSGGTFAVHYNYSTNFALTGVTNDGTNITATNTTLNADGLVTSVGSNTINGGAVDSAFADINLTRNDVGCYGGSYTLDNFFPITSNDWARVILVTAPRRILVNGTINVKAIGYDK